MGRDALKPLDGILVVSLEQAVAAPFCSSRLADAGARVIKVERTEGDFARNYDSVVHGESAYFVWLNRGKESLTANIKDEVGKTTYTQMLNKDGGIETDLTVVCLDKNYFRIVSSAATREHDKYHILKHLSDDVSLKDVTEEICCLGIF